MTAAKRGAAIGEPSLAGRDGERQAIVHRDFRFDLTHWIGTDPRLALRVMKLVEEILRDPFTGIGKPEPLKHSRRGEWSRRVTDHHRIEYIVTSMAVFFIRARSHYSS